MTNLAPAPAAGQSAPVTVYFYDTSLRQTGQRLPDGAVVTNVFLANGLIQKTWGSRLYPVEYTFDYAGRMKTMTTWQQFNQATGSGLSGSAVTTWNYDTARGWLTNKTYADGLGPVYTNTPSGRLGKRTWARAVSTVYSYNAAGDLTGADYSDATPDISYGYDRLGRQTAATNGTVAMTRLFSDVGLLLAENHATGPLAGLAVSNRYDQYLRRTNLSILNLPSSILYSQSYGFDSVGRLATVSSGTNTAAYGYLANSPPVEHIWFTNGSTLRMTTTKQYDLLNRLTEISSVSSASSVVRSAYAYNSVNQRTALTNADNSYWVYTYDSLGQVTSGRKYWANGTPVAGQQFDYTIDSIGNRQTAASGGNQFGTGLRQQNYSANNLNQYTSRTVPPYVDVLGTAASNATVTVWGDKALPILSTDPAGLVRVLRQGEYWRAEVPLNNSTGALWLTLTNYAVLNQGTNADVLSSTTGRVLVAKSPEAITYDTDGNLTSDSLWTNTWNGENRRVTVESGTGILPVARMREQWTFLPDGRWIERIVSTNNGSTYYAAYTNRYVWDGNVLMAVLDHTNGLGQSFTRGLDLSGTSQGAGGAGGLLWIWDRSTLNTQPSTHAAAFDGNGNVMALVNLSDATTSAEYAYGPFAEPLQATGPMAKANPLRFSTQYADDITGDVNYLFRGYTSRTGRWLRRDPLGTVDGANLYGFANNGSVNHIDIYGQDWVGIFPVPPATPPKPSPILPNPGTNPGDGPPIAEWSYDLRTYPDITFKLIVSDFGPQNPVSRDSDLGRTWATLWDMKLKLTPCPGAEMWRVNVAAQARIRFWWSVTQWSGVGEYSSYGHELAHVSVWTDAFHSAYQRVDQIPHRCLCEAQARAYAEYAEAVWRVGRASANWQNDDYDCNNPRAQDQQACNRLQADTVAYNRAVDFMLSQWVVAHGIE